jgi:hypothetical protein
MVPNQGMGDEQRNIKIILGITVAAIVAAFFFDPVSQDPSYHLFVDDRTLLAVPNFWNVASNIPFLFAGAMGMAYLRTNTPDTITPALSPCYQVFFLGVFLTGFGSAYYHLAPGNGALVWDRLPMTISFMGFFALIVGEYINVDYGRRSLIPLLLVGAGSVVYWAMTEGAGHGDLRPYALVQFLPMLLIPLILIVFKSGRMANKTVWWMIAAYAVSKLFEAADVPVYEIGGFISGHSIKHVVAAVAPFILLSALKRNGQAQTGTRPTI